MLAALPLLVEPFPFVPFEGDVGDAERPVDVVVFVFASTVRAGAALATCSFAVVRLLIGFSVA